MADDSEYTRGANLRFIDQPINQSLSGRGPLNTNPYTPPQASEAVADDAGTASGSTPKPRSLIRGLGFYMATAVVVGNVIGSGIFLKPGNIAANCGRFDLIIAIWVFGGVLCVLGALCFAELGAMLPKAGGLYVYLRHAYGRPVAFLFGWCEFFFAKPASIGALAAAFIGSLSYAMEWQLGVTIEVVLAVVLISGMAIINILGVVWGGRVQLLFTLLKGGFLALVALSPLLLAPFIGAKFEAANFASTVAPRNPALSAQIGAVLLAVMWAYNGWHGITPLAEEVRRPARNIPLALLLGVGILIFLYVGANFAYHGVLSMDELAAAGDNGAERMLEKLLGRAGVAMMSAVIMCSTFGAINTNLLQAPRVAFAMGRDGAMFRDLSAVHATYRTPIIAILALTVMSIALVIGVAVGKHNAAGFSAEQFQWELPQKVIVSLQDDSIFDLLTNFVIFASSIFYMLGVLSLIVLRWKMPDVRRPYKTLGYPLPAILFLVVYAWFLWQVYQSNPLEAHSGLAFIALGLPVYFAYRYFAGRREEGPPA